MYPKFKQKKYSSFILNLKATLPRYKISQDTSIYSITLTKITATSFNFTISKWNEMK